MLDLLVRNGSVVDGTGGPARRADVGVRDGRIVAVGDVDESAARVVDADGLVVSPGFIDNHTHYDAQLFWDASLHPSPLHGITTSIAGGCGYTLAPMPASEQEYLLTLLARVEAVPREALEAGVDISWTSYPEFLDAADRGLGLNIGFMVGHSAIRRAVMGAAGSEDKATPEQIAAMQRLLRESLGAGGFGFSTALQRTHVDWNNHPTPAQMAGTDELVSLASVCSEFPGTSVQATPQSGNYGIHPEERELFTAMSAAAQRTLFWLTVKFVKEVPDMTASMLDFCDQAAERGGRLYGMVFLQDGGSARQDFSRPFLLRANPAPWPEIMDLSHDERRRALADPAVRDRLREGLNTPGHALGAGFDHRWGSLVVGDVDDPRLEPLIGQRVGAIAAERGVDAFDAMLDIAVDGDLEVGFLRNDEGDTGNRDPWVRATRYDAMRDARVIWGANDSGAHSDAICGASFPSRAIEELVRKEQQFSLEQVVRRLTGEQAERWGLKGRGKVAPGYVADLAIFDPDAVSPTRMEKVRDWPGGAWHLVQRGEGFHRTVVGGRDVVVDGEYTGDLPGRVLRSGRDTETVPL